MQQPSREAQALTPQRDTSRTTRDQTERSTLSRSGTPDRFSQDRQRGAGSFSGGPSRSFGTNDGQASSRFGGSGSTFQRSDTRSLGSPRGLATQRMQAEARHEGLSSRLSDPRRHVETRGFASAPHRDSGTRFGVGLHADFGTHRPSYLHARYYDRPDLIRHSDRHIYMYYDPYNRLHHRVIWPGYYYPLYYSFGPSVYCDYVWPYYHRKYVFVSLGGWWPYDYTYMRYYWYGYHPYLWYGYYPVAREVAVGSDNYYTYNYNYYGDDGSPMPYSSDAPIDPVTQARLRANLEQQRAAAPAPQTLADTRFDEGVKSFEAGEYAAAAVKFDEAMRLSPNDMILPFAYAQALFADGQYDKAADMLREALKNATPEKEGVFFPRGLYSNDDVLFAQVEKLVDKADQAENDADLQLLLGYQLLGVGETEYAREQLEQAARDPKDAAPAGILLNVVEKMEKEAGAANKAGGDTIQMPAAPEVKTEPPARREPPGRATGATIGEMMSAGQAGTTAGAESTVVPPVPAQEAPVVPATIAPATEPESKPVVPGVQPPDAGTEGPGAVNEPSPAPTQDVQPRADNEANANGGRAGIVQESDKNAAVEEAGFVGSPDALVSGLSRLVGRGAPNYKADVVIFASILSLAVTGVWIEWRLLSRQPA
jgi:tetratricopeptide (TPR) repeat protein